MSRLLTLVTLLLVLSATPALALDRDQRRHADIIMTVFGRHGADAVRVAKCESRLRTWARNGQYLGLFQMGDSERQQFGHGPGAWAQARAAYRYFVASGRSWRPWSCKPWYT